MKRRNELLVKAREAIRHPFASGGYPVYIMFTDGEFICPLCARENYPQISKDTRRLFGNGWDVMSVDIYWEGPTENCVQCNEPVIESAYGDPNEPDAE